ncbi:hypothetical protein DFH07DRAFT_268066 [Mycena maculata]|uniref:Zn(2)-C6 fungal-type domain-containing protein n=1 Tax=Mycena maculata TaxID=230809 RepID=A0AAD7JV83_9AGAR|nr:hypothetical protein DFH07DRAFT_268066 [Mycena maculata]
MPADTASTTKRRSTKAALSTDVAYRKRRNRTTQSCLNCHTTKRMCDRKRPCSRCTQLGLTGLCIYEVDDPARKPTVPDESSRLLSRIAELEGVVRELKNKPHPRCADGQDTTLPRSPPSALASLPKSPSKVDVDPTLPNLSSFGDIPWADLLNWNSPGSSESAYSHSPVSTPSPLLVSASRWPEASPPFVHSCHSSPWNAQVPRKPDTGGCDCLSEPACYNTAVELASELRRAAAVMDRSLSHCFGPTCTLNTKISELEALTMNALRNARICPDALEMSRAPVRFQGYSSSTNGRTRQQHPLRQDSFWDENGLPAYDDSFMSWIPKGPR